MPIVDANMEAWEAAKNALKCFLEAEKEDSIVIFCDDEKINIGEAFAAGALNMGLQTRLIILKTEPKVFREENSEESNRGLQVATSDLHQSLPWCKRRSAIPYPAYQDGN